MVQNITVILYLTPLWLRHGDRKDTLLLIEWRWMTPTNHVSQCKKGQGRGERLDRVDEFEGTRCNGKIDTPTGWNGEIDDAPRHEIPVLPHMDDHWSQKKKGLISWGWGIELGSGSRYIGTSHGWWQVQRGN